MAGGLGEILCGCGFEGVLTNFQKLPLSSTIFRLLPLFLPLFSPEIGLRVCFFSGSLRGTKQSSVGMLALLLLAQNEYVHV